MYSIVDHIQFVIVYSLIPSTLTFHYLSKKMSAKKSYIIAMLIWGSVFYFYQLI